MRIENLSLFCTQRKLKLKVVNQRELSITKLLHGFSLVFSLTLLLENKAAFFMFDIIGYQAYPNYLYNRVRHTHRKASIKAKKICMTPHIENIVFNAWKMNNEKQNRRYIVCLCLFVYESGFALQQNHSARLIIDFLKHLSHRLTN